MRSIIIRPAAEPDIPAIARVHVESWRTTYKGILSDTFLAGLSQQKHEERHRRNMSRSGTVYMVAEARETGIVGFAIGGPERSNDQKFLGELYAIYITQAYQRSGIGAAMAEKWAASLMSSGISSALVCVLAKNTAAIKFYERLGAKFLRAQLIDIGGESLIESVYGVGGFKLSFTEIRITARPCGAVA